MAERAAINRHYHLRILIIGLACVAMSAWFLRDGYVKYPKMQRVHQRYVQLKEQYPRDWQQRWTEIVRTEGVPELPEAKSDADIMTQKLFGYLLLPVGVFILLRFALNLRRWIEVDEGGLLDQSGRRIAWEQITGLDKSRWERKGIAVVQYANEKGPGRLVLDDWKYDRPVITGIVQRVDQQLGASDPPQPPNA